MLKSDSGESHLEALASGDGKFIESIAPDEQIQIEVSVRKQRNRARRTIVLLVSGLALLAGALIWQLAIPPRWARRITPGWNWQSRFIGIQSNADPETGKLPEKDSPGIYQKSMVIVPGTLRSDSVELLDTYTVRDSLTGTVTWQYAIQARVNPITARHLTPGFQNDHVVFPRNVQKQTYQLRFNYVKGVPLNFEREENLLGLDTYVFGYKGYGEYTESYAGTEEYPGIKVLPGQEIRCADDQFVLKMWIEPLTGETVKVEESCYSNDYLVDVASGKRLALIDKWGGVVTGNDVRAAVERTQAIRRKYLLMTQYVPIGLLTGGLLMLAGAIFVRKRTK